MTDDTTKPPKKRGRRVTQAPAMGVVHELFPNSGQTPGRQNKAGKVVIPPPGVANKVRGPDGTRLDKRPVSILRADGPNGAKLRVGKRWSQIMRAIQDGEYTWEEFVDALDDEELARGQIKAQDGTFRGRPPSLVPRAFFNACQNAILKRGAIMWKDNYPLAMAAMMKIMNDDSVKPETRLKATQFVIERIEGKVPTVVQVSVEDPWQTALAGVVAEVSEEAAIGRAHDYTAREDAVRAFDNDEED